jgi:hypothetical protein
MPIRFLSITTIVLIFGGLSATHAQEGTYNQLANAIMNPNYNTAPVNRAALEAKPLNAKKEIPKHGVIKYDIYRDRQPYPVDPRKPCHVCIQRQGNSKFAALHSRIPGYQGRPYQMKEPGGCECGKKKQKFKHLNLNAYWPTFAAGVGEEFFPCKSDAKARNYDRFRLVDIFDGLGGFEISGYQRRDNGYCGKERDRYGCLGESKYFQSQVRGVGFREPGQPVERGGIVFP